MEMDTYIDNGICYFGVQWVLGRPVLHLEAKQWSHTLYRDYYIPTWNDFQKYLKENDEVDYAYVFMYKDNAKQKKFLEKFGFVHAYEEDNLLAMVKEL